MALAKTGEASRDTTGAAAADFKKGAVNVSTNGTVQRAHELTA